MRIFFSILLIVFAFPSEKISFVSANPFSFKDIITDLSNQEKQEVFGILKFPNNYSKDKKFPLIIGVAGSLDWGQHHHRYLELYRSMGIAHPTHGFSEALVDIDIAEDGDGIHSQVDFEVLEKFIEYFKWVDDAVTIMIAQLLPVSSNSVELLRNMVESHILERN